jgi:HSP20 family protein
MATNPTDWMWIEACAVLEQMHGQFFRPGSGAMGVAAWQPPIDVFETADGLRIVAGVPGVDARNVEVVLERDILTIGGVRHVAPIARGADILRLEIPYGHFERQVQLPSGRFEFGCSEITNGCLFITLTKRR